LATDFETRSLPLSLAVYSTLNELDRFCEQMKLIARKGLPA
jgi:hypothetical protein